MNELYRIEFTGKGSVYHRIRIFDKDGVDDNQYTQIANEAPGYELSWDRGITDVVKGGFMTSEASVFMNNRGKQNLIASNNFAGAVIEGVEEQEPGLWYAYIDSGEGSYSVSVSENYKFYSNSLRYEQTTAPRNPLDHRVEQVLKDSLSSEKTYNFQAYVKASAGTDIIINIIDSENGQAYLNTFTLDESGWQTIKGSFSPDTSGECTLKIIFGADSNVKYITGVEIMEDTYNIGILDDFLDNLRTNNENRYLVSIQRESESPWFGIILNDFSKLGDNYYQSVELSAVDGVGFLKEIDYTTQNFFLDTFAEALRELPTIMNFYQSTDPCIRTYTKWYSETMPSGTDYEPLHYVRAESKEVWTKIKEKEGYDGTINVVEEKSSLHEVLEHILTRFRAVMFQFAGYWYIMQTDDLFGSAVFREFDRNGQSRGTSTLDIIDSVNQSDIYRAGCSFSYLPALGKVQGRYITKNNGSLITQDFAFGTTYETPQLQTGTGNYLHIKLKLDVYFGGLTGPGNDWLNISMQVKVGIYYLQADGSWDTSSNTIDYKTSGASGPSLGGSGNKNASLSVELYTEDIPETNTAEIKIINSGSANGNTYGIQKTAITVKHIEDNEAPPDYVEYTAENTGSTLKYELDDSLIGSGGALSRGLLGIYVPGTGIVTNVNDKWRQGDTEGFMQFFNQLLVNETLGNQKKYLLVLEGTIYNESADLISLFRRLQITYNENTYSLFANKVKYNPLMNTWDGSWFEVNRVATRTAVLKKINNKEFDISQVSAYTGKLNRFIDADNGDIDTEGGSLSLGSGALNVDGANVDLSGLRQSTSGGIQDFDVGKKTLTQSYDAKGNPVASWETKPLYVPQLASQQVIHNAVTGDFYLVFPKFNQTDYSYLYVTGLGITDSNGDSTNMIISITTTQGHVFSDISFVTGKPYVIIPIINQDVKIEVKNDSGDTKDVAYFIQGYFQNYIISNNFPSFDVFLTSFSYQKITSGDIDSVYDISLNTNNAVSAAGAEPNEKEKTIGDFDASNQERLIINHNGSFSYDNTQSRTIAIWLKATNSGSTAYIIHKGGNYMIYKDSSNNLICAIDDGANSANVSVGSGVFTNEYVSVIFEIDRTNDKMKLYIDNVLQDTNNDISLIGDTSNTDDLYLGCKGGTVLSSFYDGELDEFIVIPSILSDQERLNLYLHGKSIHPPIIY
jgi:hypothetical protein